MLRRLSVVPVLAALALLAPTAHASGPVPQLNDPSGDANFGNAAGQPTAPARDKPTLVGSQDYADVLSVLWQSVKTTKVVRKHKVTTVTGFTVTVTLSGAPTPPDHTSLVYRMLGTTGNCPIFGVAYYTTKHSDKNIPQSALRENCNHTGTTAVRLTAIPMPTIAGKTITWNVPLSALPKDTKVGVGTKVDKLWFQVAEIEDFQGHCVPDDSFLPLQTGYGNACGLGAGIVDDSSSVTGTGSYTIGS